MADRSATGPIIGGGGVVASGAWGGRPTLAVSAVAGIALLAFSVAACGSGGSRAWPARPAPGGQGRRPGRPPRLRGHRRRPGPRRDRRRRGRRGRDVDRRAVIGATQSVDSQRADPFSAAVDGYLAGRSGTVLAAVYDVRTGQSWRLGDGPAQDEASVVKVDILETLLSASDGTGLSSDNQGLAAADDRRQRQRRRHQPLVRRRRNGGTGGLQRPGRPDQDDAVGVRGLRRLPLAGLGADHHRPRTTRSRC